MKNNELTPESPTHSSRFNQFYRIMILPGLLLFVVTGYISMSNTPHPNISPTVGYPFWIRLLGTFMIGPISIILGWFLARRSRNNFIGPIILLWGCVVNLEMSVGYLPPFLATLSVAFVTIVILPGFALMLASFPTGRGVTPAWDRRMKGLTLWSMGMALLGQLTTHETFGLTTPSPLAIDFLLPFSNGIGTVNTLSLITSLLTAFALIIYRYRITHVRERKQIRWLMLAGAYILLFFVIAPALNWGSGMGFLATVILLITTLLVFVLPSIAVSLAILYHRLWDIDIIIRRTVQYSIVSAVLAAVYFGSITLIQGGITAVTNTQSPFAIVLSTLLVAALFNPLRQRVQAFIDRRFYRQKYDAQQVLAQFAQTARDEVDMEALQTELLRVVQETMQPQTITLWLKSTDH